MTFPGDNSWTVDDCESVVHPTKCEGVLLHLTVRDKPVDRHASPGGVRPLPHTGARAHQVHQSTGAPRTCG